MQQYLLEPPIYLLDHRLTTDWQKNSILTAKNIFTRLGPSVRHALGIPEIDGDGKPKWMADVANKIVVVKNDLTRERSFGICHTAANEKISSGIAQYLHLRVPHVLLWERTYSRNRVMYFSITPRVFPDAERAPPDNILMADITFPAMPVFDAYLLDGDGGRPSNILYCASSPPENPLTAYLDKGLADLEEINDYRAFDPVNIIFKSWYIWNAKIRAHLEHEIPNSPVVAEVITRIENIPQQVISDVVNEVPNALFHTPQSKPKIIDNLCRRRETIRKQVTQAFEIV